jgi:hypothetical protein
MRELAQIDKASVNRPVPELANEAPGIIDIITQKNGSEGAPHIASAGNTHAERVQEALGNMYMDITCSNCGSSKVIRAGACGCCTECGTSQGCS